MGKWSSLSVSKIISSTFSLRWGKAFGSRQPVDSRFQTFDFWTPDPREGPGTPRGWIQGWESPRGPTRIRVKVLGGGGLGDRGWRVSQPEWLFLSKWPWGLPRASCWRVKLRKAIAMPRLVGMLSIPAGGVPIDPVAGQWSSARQEREIQWLVGPWGMYAGHLAAHSSLLVSSAVGSGDVRTAQVMPSTQGFHIPLSRWLPVYLPALSQQWVMPGQHPQLHLHLLLRLWGQELCLWWVPTCPHPISPTPTTQRWALGGEQKGTCENPVSA